MDEISKGAFDAAMQGINLRAKSATAAGGDYKDAEGYLCCGKCHTRKECDISITIGGLQRKMRVSHLCKCQLEARCKREAEAQAIQRADYLQRMCATGITDPAFYKARFSDDDCKDKAKSDVCRRYVAEFDAMAESNTGMMLYGDVGTGKSFFACCIGNELQDIGKSVLMTSLSRLLNFAGFDRQEEMIRRVQQCDLLILDDVGAERDTSYAAEQIFNIIDARHRSQRPLICTTNIALSAMQSEANTAYKRIYDRLLDMCPIRMKMEGQSRRATATAEKRKKAIELLGL